MSAHRHGSWERPDADTVRMMAAMRTLRWWDRVQPAGPWLLAPTRGFGPNMIWGIQVPVVAVGARIEEPLEVRLARAFLHHIGRL